MEENSQEKAQDLQAKFSPNALIIAFLFLGILGVGYFLYRQRAKYNYNISNPTPATQNTQSTLDKTPTLTQDEGVREITVEGSEFSFSPSSITLSKGEKIRIIFRNKGGAPHNFVVESLGVATKTIPPGGTDTVEFVADKSGSFTFYCAVGNHRQLGMEGKLNVE